MSNKNGKPMKTWVKVVLGVVVVAVLAVTAVPFIYIHFIKEDTKITAKEQGLPERATIPETAESSVTTTDPATTAAPQTTVAATGTTVAATGTTVAATGTTVAATAGTATYKLTMSDDIDETYVGYRVVEVLFGQDTEGVGRTNTVTGSLALAGSEITQAEFTVDMTTLHSDEDNRDRKFKGEIMDTSKFPNATFTITEPIELGSVPADGIVITATATGDLTLHGVTKSVTIDVTAQRNGDIVDVVGSTDVVFSDYDIDNPSNGGITTEDHGLIELRLTFTKG